MPVSHGSGGHRLDARRIEQPVEDRYRPGDGHAAADVERGPGRGRQAHSPPDVHLVIGQPIAVDATIPG
ncbi:hypothetical protein AWC23_27260 [Mycobacterium saskatchewanense]|uniref:Uncharacterized protein n=1 Tax=Mycobacterium saskatchewanense TaxID=220927 RepID=A0AAJ3NL41_9MYCO|nr:hypothetical protein AWC23_27260 [Mycobacterium saskatchewanense]